MYQIAINGRPVIMSKFFSAADREAVLGAIPEGTQQVVFIDTPATSDLVATIEALVSRGVEVVVRDHHDVPNPLTPRDGLIHAAANLVREMVGANAVISDRQTNPACSSLIEVGQFTDEGTVIVADPDPDGLTASMKAAAVYYPELDTDADVLDGGRAGQTAEKLSPNAYLLVRAMASLPPYDAARPQVSENAKAKLFSDFVSVVQGDTDAKARLEKGVEAYEACVRAAEELASKAFMPYLGVYVVDAVGAPRYDLGTLATRLEAKPDCTVTIIIKDAGPIVTALGGTQYSLAVARSRQAEVNLQEFLPERFTSSPATGIISNTSFLLHVSEKVWLEEVQPRLHMRFKQQ